MHQVGMSAATRPLQQVAVCDGSPLLLAIRRANVRFCADFWAALHVDWPLTRQHAPPACMCSASVLRLAIPSAVLATALHSSLWGGTPPAVVAVAEVAAWGGTIIAGGTEVWKILEGFRG